MWRSGAVLVAALLALVLVAGCLVADRWGTAQSPEMGEPLDCELDRPAPSQPPVDAGEEPLRPEPTPEPTPVPVAPTPTPTPGPQYPQGAISKESRQVGVGGKTFGVTLVRVPLGSATPNLGLAKGRVGCTESLASIARRANAMAAINGCFFDAYSDRPVRNPYGVLISEGRVLHTSDHPTTLGVWPDGTVAIDQVTLRIQGGSGHSTPWLRDWYAYGLNHFPEQETCATIYTPQYGQNRSPDHGLYIVVQDGKVAARGYGPLAIPRDGYVIYLRGAEAQLDKRFEVGARCTYALEWDVVDGRDWSAVQEALGCGPLLVRAEEVVADPVAEGFKDPKVLTNAGSRSAVGLTSEGHLLLVTCPSATIGELAQVMKGLNCRDAMNLDGGASSGLYFRDRYLVKPGRDISNALLVLAR